EKIAFHFTSGDLASYAQWRKGMRPKVEGKKVAWSKTAKPDESHESFREYLDTVFTYAGTQSLSRELKAVPPTAEPQIGEVFIHPGSPGHAVIIVDLAQHQET